jgi:NADH-quinone oxidoreductase subunit I
MASLAVTLAGSFAAMGATLRNFFRRGNTVQYPLVTRPIPRQWRGGTFALTLDPKTGEENCIGCRLCEYICPSQIIRVTLRKGEKRRNDLGATYCDHFSLDYQACMQCELCVQVCPTDAIIMLRTFDLATADRREMLLDKDRLHALGRQFPASWATGNGLRAMQAPAPKGSARGEAAAGTTPTAKDAAE